jgi:hypothetical protein
MTKLLSDCSKLVTPSRIIEEKERSIDERQSIVTTLYKHMQMASLFFSVVHYEF